MAEINSSPYKGSAQITREQFLFYEMRTTAKLMREGLNDEEIIDQIVEDNLFQYPTEKSIRQMAKACVANSSVSSGDQSILFSNSVTKRCTSRWKSFLPIVAIIGLRAGIDMYFKSFHSFKCILSNICCFMLVKICIAVFPHKKY